MSEENTQFAEMTFEERAAKFRELVKKLEEELGVSAGTFRVELGKIVEELENNPSEPGTRLISMLDIEPNDPEFRDITRP